MIICLVLEVYAIEIQMYSELRETKKLKVSCRSWFAALELGGQPYGDLQTIYEATMRVRSAMPHPRILGVIRECGGKMWMGESRLSPSSL